MLSDLAALEKALNDAFDAAEAPVLALGDMAGFAPEIWNDLVFQAHPSAYRLDLVTNAPAIWLALKNDETPPDAAVLEVALAPADLAAGHHADVPRACQPKRR